SRFFFSWSRHPRHLHSFPTRRSSDLDAGPLGRLPHQRLDGSLEAELVEETGPRLAGDAAHDLHRLVHPLGKRRVAQSEDAGIGRSEEHTSELQSLAYLVCRLLLEKKK